MNDNISTSHMKNADREHKPSVYNRMSDPGALFRFLQLSCRLSSFPSVFLFTYAFASKPERAALSSVILAHAVLQTQPNFNTAIPNCLLFASISLAVAFVMLLESQLQ